MTMNNISLVKNQVIQLTINDITAEGNGVGRYNNTVVFAPMTALGDVINCKIVKVLKNYCFGIVDSFISQSGDRVPPDCEVFSKCGGCSFRHINYSAELVAKHKWVQDVFQRIGNISTDVLPIISCNDRNFYRNKAQYPVGRAEDGKAICGFYAKRSHRIIPYTKCSLQPEVFSKIVDFIIDYVNISNILPYDEVSNSGELRHIYIRQGYHSKQIMVCLVCKLDISKKLSNLVKELVSNFKDISTIVLNVNPKITNVILGTKNITLFGNGYISDTMCDNIVNLSPMAFYQVNTNQAERLYSIAKEFAQVSKKDILLDLYCGTGTIGLSMAKDVHKLIGVDIVEQSIENAKVNAIQNDIHNAEFFCGDAGIIASQLAKDGLSPTVITIDPARKGCDSLAINTIVSMNPQRIVMISCNPATASRDCKEFQSLGYVVEKIQPVDMFPCTAHVECVVLMSKVQN